MDTLARVERIGVLRAYKWVVSVAAPDLHADLEARSERWGRASPEQLSDELAGFLREASRVSCPVRLFFKVRAELVYGGCNTQFAKDAGLDEAAMIVGADDFDPRLSWVGQAAKYRRDDREVLTTGRAKLGIIERQTSSSGVIWLDTSKVPIEAGDKVIGIFGAYEVIDAKTAEQRMRARKHGEPKTSWGAAAKPART